MIRVFVLAVLALLALVVIARNLPDGSPAIPEDSGLADEISPLARWEGAWEGTLTARRPDGEAVSEIGVFQQHETVSSTEQVFSITERHPDGRTQEVNGRTILVGDRLERHFQGPDGSSVVYSGLPEEGAIRWHRQDPETGLEESFREEIIRSEGGDLFVIDGMRRVQTPREEVLLIEGRFRRAVREED